MRGTKQVEGPTRCRRSTPWRSTLRPDAATGRKSLGSAPKRCLRRWLNQRTDAALFAASVGNAPLLVDVVKMVHPKPGTREREALKGY
jgi:hypothetical protein